MLKKATIAFVGGGNMATAMIQGLLKAGISSDRIRVSEPNKQSRNQLEKQFNVTTVAENSSVIVGANVVVIAVKPGVVTRVLKEIEKELDKTTLVISIAAGISLSQIVELLPKGQPIVRVMPNTPALIGAGISVLICMPNISQEKRILARQLMSVAGDVVEISDESMMDGVTALSGSGPAYVYLIAEALSDGGVACGLPRPLADKLAVKTLIGSARLIDETGTHPAVLKSQVTSPGGTTIAGLKELESNGVRGSLIKAVEAAWKRSKELSGN